MNLRQAAQQALEALEKLGKWEHPASNITNKQGDRIYPHRVAVEASAVLRTALAEPEQDDTALLRQALEALKQVKPLYEKHDIIAALRERLGEKA